MNAGSALFDEKDTATATNLARHNTRALRPLVAGIPLPGAAIQTGVLDTNAQLVPVNQFAIVADSFRRGISQMA
jgi:hypothetical protein